MDLADKMISPVLSHHLPYGHPMERCSKRVLECWKTGTFDTCLTTEKPDPENLTGAEFHDPTMCGRDFQYYKNPSLHHSNIGNADLN